MAILSDNLIHLDAAYRPVAGLSAPERIDWIRQDRWIQYARAEQVVARLTDLLTYDPRRLQGVTVYREAVRTFAVGDRLQFTAPVPIEKIANRELGTVTAISSEHELRVRTDAGKTVTLPGDPARQGAGAHRHVDHGYAVTSHSSQGLTADRVLLYIDSERAGERLVNQRLAYVALSRGRHDARIYTDDRERLPAALSRHVSKSSAHQVRPGTDRQHHRPHTTVQGHQARHHSAASSPTAKPERHAPARGLGRHTRDHPSPQHGGLPTEGPTPHGPSRGPEQPSAVGASQTRGTPPGQGHGRG